MSSTPGPETNLDRLQRWFDAYQSDGFDGAERMVDELFDPQIEFSPLLARELEGRRYEGRDGVRNFFRELDDVLDGMSYKNVRPVVVSEDVIVVFAELIGRGRDSSVPISQQLGTVFQFRKGLVWRMTAYGSEDEALAAAKELQHA